ncbi:MAG: IclR family transcriptional regulator [Clostridia bacterium]
MKQKLAKSNQSVEKVLQIIEIMSESRKPMRLQDIALRAELPASTTLRLVNTLLTHGYANQDPETLRYTLSLKLTHIGSLVASQVSIRDSAHPYLLELSHKCQEAACLAIDENMQVVYMDVVDGPDGMLKITQRIGKVSPMHCTGIGKILMLNYTMNQVNQYIALKGLTIFTPHTIATKNDLLDELDTIRNQNYALDNEECELGARCIAAGIKDYSGKYVGGISISGPLSRMTIERMDVLKDIVIDTANKISKLLSYQNL